MKLVVNGFFRISHTYLGRPKNVWKEERSRGIKSVLHTTSLDVISDRLLQHQPVNYVN